MEKKSICFKDKNNLISLSKMSEIFKKIIDSAKVIDNEILKTTEDALNKECTIKLTYNELENIYYELSSTEFEKESVDDINYYELIKESTLKKIIKKIRKNGYNSFEDISEDILKNKAKIKLLLKEVYLIITIYSKNLTNINANKLLDFELFIKKIRNQLEDQKMLDYLEVNKLYEIEDEINKNIEKLFSTDIIINNKKDNNNWLKIDNTFYSIDNCLEINNLTDEENNFLASYLDYNYKLAEIKKEDLPFVMTICSRFDGEERLGNIISNIMIAREDNTYDYCNILEYQNKHDIDETLPLIRKYEIRLLNGERADNIYETLKTEKEKDLLVKAYYNLLNKGYVASQYNIWSRDLDLVDLPFCYNDEINLKLLNISKGNLPKFRI